MPYYGDAWPTFSPDGKWIAVFIGEEGRFGDYWVIPSHGGDARRLTNDFAEGGGPAWTPDGKFLVFPSARAGSVNLWRVAVSGGVPEALTTGPGDDLWAYTEGILIRSPAPANIRLGSTFEITANGIEMR